MDSCSRCGQITHDATDCPYGPAHDVLGIAPLNTYTVFAVYEDDLQPYAETVRASDPHGACDIAQRHADESNGVPCPLTSWQVVAGECEVVL